MTTAAAPMKLPTLAEWAEPHVKSIFEATSVDNTIQALDNTFAWAKPPNVTLNGMPLDRAGVEGLILNMRPSPEGGLKVEWRELVGVPLEPSHRVGA